MMLWRGVVVAGLVLALASGALADIITLKDGKSKTVRIYKVAKEYLSYLADGQIHVISRDKLKGYKITEKKPIGAKELAAAIKKTRVELKKKVREEAKKNGGKTTPDSVVKGVDGAKGVKVIDKSKSKTKATELKIDPFPDIPVKGEKPKPKVSGRRPPIRKRR
jgi:hypothetical protein